MDRDQLPKKRLEAREKGLKHYFTGKACKHGHISIQSLAKGCMECDRLRAASKLAEKRNDPEKWEKLKEYNRNRMRKVLSDPSVRKRVRELESANYHSNENRRKKKAAADAIRHKRLEVIEARKARVRAKYNALKDDPDFREKQRTAGREHYKKNPLSFYEACGRRRARRLSATPKWVGAEEKTAIKAFYAEAARLTETTGIKHEVDHVIPLKHEFVCGLHVAANLQILTAAQNRSKGNRFELSDWHGYLS